MADNHIARGQFRWWLAVVLLTILTLTFIGMGRWQLSRADERRAVAQQIEQGRRAEPKVLNSQNAGHGFKPWQAATASGQWLPQYSVLLDNRSQEGKPGLWLVMPLRLDDGAVLPVVRGWLPRPLGSEPVSLHFHALNENQRVVGEIADHIPRLYELQEDGEVRFVAPTEQSNGTWAIDVRSMPWRQNLSHDQLSVAIGEPVLPVVLMQTGEDDGVTFQGMPLVRQWPEPSIDADKNIGYAMQWFLFATIAFGALVALLWRLLRREKISS